MSTEKGENKHRPHHHMILYGENFEEDRRQGPISKSGHIQYISGTLNKLWAVGNCTIQDCNPNNIIYCAQYSLKKEKTNENERYRAIQSFSNRSKISTKWVRRNYNEIKKGYITDIDGKKYRIPKSYKNTLKESDNELHREAYRIYEQNIMERIGDNSTKDLIEKQLKKEEIRKLRMKNLGKNRDF